MPYCSGEEPVIDLVDFPHPDPIEPPDYTNADTEDDDITERIGPRRSGRTTAKQFDS